MTTLTTLTGYPIVYREGGRVVQGGAGTRGCVDAAAQTRAGKRRRIVRCSHERGLIAGPDESGVAADLEKRYYCYLWLQRLLCVAAATVMCVGVRVQYVEWWCCCCWSL